MKGAPHRLQGWLAAALVGCASAGGAPEPDVAEPAPEPVAMQPCPLEESPLEVPVARGWALAASAEGCLLVDEGAEGVFLSLAALPHDAEGAEALADEPRTFLREAGLLGPEPRFTGTERITLVGRETEAEAFVAELEGVGPRAGLAAVRRVGPSWVLALLFHAPGDATAREALVDALERIEAGSAQPSQSQTPP